MLQQEPPVPEKCNIEEKAIQKYPFTLNGQTYFSSDCYFNQTIINGIELELKEAKGIPNEESTISFLNYSNRLMFYVGTNIVSYNTYKRKYDVICESHNLLALHSDSLSTPEKEYVSWIEKVNEMEKDSMDKFVYKICLYDLTLKEKVCCEIFYTIEEDLKSDHISIIVFIHPIKLIGITIYSPELNSTQIIFKKMLKINDEEYFSDELSINVPYKLSHIKYDIESNSYFFMKNEYEIGLIRNIYIHEHEPHIYLENVEETTLEIDVLVNITNEKLGERKIVHFNISETYLLILTRSLDNTERYFEFYSLFSYELIFSQIIQNEFDLNSQPNHKQSKKQKNEMEVNVDLDSIENLSSYQPIDFVEFNKSVIIGLRGNTTDITIFSLYEQNLRHIRNTTLDLDNCYKISRLLINPLSSEVIILSKHYELEGTMTTAQKSTKFIQEQKIAYKNFFMEISSFFITMEASIIKVQKLNVQKKNYSYILTSPWLSEFFLQTENSIKSKKWEEKFDSLIICSAIHPMGQYIALGFKDCFKVYYLTHEKLIHTFFSENVKECISLSYSKPGHEFAAATTYNIYIYDCFSYIKKHHICLGMSYRIEEISYIEGFENGKMKHSLQCVTNNKRLVVYNADKEYKEEYAFNPKSHVENNVIETIMEMASGKLNKISSFDLFGEKIPADTKRETGDVNGEINVLSKKFGAIIYDEKTKVVIFTLGSKIYFMHSENFQSLGIFDFEEVSCIEICRELNTMFFGTASGKIIAFPWPNKPVNICSKIPTYSVHRNRIKKIKVSSNFCNLISTTDESMYIHTLTLVHEMRKVRKNELQREYCPQSVVALDFFLRAGLCLFTSEKFEEKGEIIKENEEEAVNFNFILPEEREKQKKIMLEKLECEKYKMGENAKELGIPMKMETVHLKEKIKTLEKTLKDNNTFYTTQIQKEIREYQNKIGQLSNEKESLLIKHKETTIRLQKEMSIYKEEARKESIKSEAIYRMKLTEANKKTKEAEINKKKALNNFFELEEMDEEKNIYSFDMVESIEKEVNDLLQRNGYLMCRNTNLEKDISIKKRKIEDTKDLVETTKRNIEKLPKKEKHGFISDEIKEHNQINRRFAETERKYLRETKKLIEKNKAVNVNIEIYEKEREMLVVLEKKLEEEEKNIEDILDYILKERENKKIIKEKEKTVKEKCEKMHKFYENITEKKTRIRNQLKEYLFHVSLFEGGVVGIEKLKKISEIDPKQAITTPYSLQMSIEDKKKKIEKITSAEDKIMNVQKNEKKIYSNEKRKAIAQNQDLLTNFNFLSYENKYLINVMKSQTDKKKGFIRNISSRKENHRQISKPTPFENYINFRTSRRMKTTPCAQHDLSSTN